MKSNTHNTKETTMVTTQDIADYGQPFTARAGGKCCDDCGQPIEIGERIRFRYPVEPFAVATFCHADCGARN